MSQKGFFDGFRGPRESFLRVFQNFRVRRMVFLWFFDGFLAASEKVAKEGFLKVFWEILGSQSLAGDALCGCRRIGFIRRFAAAAGFETA